MFTILIKSAVTGGVLGAGKSTVNIINSRLFKLAAANKPVGTYGFVSGIVNTAIVITALASKASVLGITKPMDQPEAIKIVNANSKAVFHVFLGSLAIGAVVGAIIGKWIANKLSSAPDLTFKEVAKIELASCLELLGLVAIAPPKPMFPTQ